MAVQTSSSVAHSYIQAYPSIFRDFKGAGQCPLPPGLAGPDYVKPQEYFSTTTQHAQKQILDYPYKKEVRYAKAPKNDKVLYMKDFCETLLRHPHNGQFPESETLRQYDVKIANEKEILPLTETDWKGKDITRSDNQFDPIARFKRQLKNLEGDDGIERMLDPYLTTSQNDFRYFHPKVLSEGIGKRDAITIYGETPGKRLDENKMKLDLVGGSSRFLGRNVPCAVDEKRRVDTYPWPIYSTRHHSKVPVAKTEHQSSFTVNALTNYDLETEFRRNIPQVENPVGSDERFTVPNMYRTESSYIGTGEILAIAK